MKLFNKVRISALWVWIFILSIAAVFRFYHLGIVPRGVTNDELGYIINAYSIAHTGRNVFGQTLPLFTYFGQGFPFMPVPTYLQSLIFLILPLSAFSGRLLNTLFGVGSVWLVGFLAKKLTGKDSIAYGAAFALAISPWHIFFTRTAYDAVPASFFYLWFLVSGITVIQKKRLTFWPFLWLLLALFSYRGMTPISAGIICIMAWYGRGLLQKHARVFWGLFLGSILIALLFLSVAYSERAQGFVAEGESVGQTAQDIELEMRATQGPQTIKRIFLNKPVALVSRLAENYAAGFDPGVLFLHGEGSQTYSMWMRGKWYIVDAAFMLVGLIFLFRTPELVSFGLLIVGLLAASGFPGMVGGAPYGSRNLFMTIPAALLVGSGWVWVLQSKKWRFILVCVLVVIYGYSVSHFLFDYFDRYADQRSEVWFASMKQVTKTLQSTTPGTSVVLANAGFYDFLQIAFYERLNPSEIQSVWKSRMLSVTDLQFRWRNILVDAQCSPDHLVSLIPDAQPLFIVRDGCWKDMQGGKRINDFYGNAVWHVYEKI